jgi:hypothetical protein
MPIYKAPVEDVTFLLRDVFQVGRYSHLSGFSDLTPEMLEAILIEAAKLCEEQVQPLNLSGDKEGCVRHPDGRVTTPKDSGRPMKPTSMAAGWAWRPIQIMAARVCPIRWQPS